MDYLKTVPYPGSGLDRVWGVSSAALCARSLSIVMETGRWWDIQEMGPCGKYGSDVEGPYAYTMILLVNE